MALTGLPYYGHCPYTRTTHEDGSATETLKPGWLTRSAISYQATPSSEQTPLWAGDRIEEIDNGGVTGTKNIRLSRLPLEREAEITGAEFDPDTNKLTMGGTPNPPYMRSGAMARMLIDNQEIYRIVVYMSVKYSPIEDNFTTKTQSPTFGNHALTGNISANADNETVVKQDFSGDGAFDNALEAFRTLLNVPAGMTKPTATPSAGTIEAGGTVALAADTGAVIRYTTNGVDVQMTSPEYAEAIAINATTTIKARAYDLEEKKSPSTQFVGVYTVE